MKRNAVQLLILKITITLAISLGQQLNQSSDIEFESSTSKPEHLLVGKFVYEQKLDHFDPMDDKKWNQNYWVVSKYYRKNGPAFLFVNGAGPVHKGNDYGFPYAFLIYAKKLNAICFVLEHRFYSNTPIENGSIFDHLSSKQALADIANFITGVSKEFHLPKNIKWIAFGCSYAGSLVAWARSFYPHLIYAAVSSGALMEAKVVDDEYLQIVEEALKSYDSKCVESITLAFKDISTIANSTESIINLSQLFCLDDDPANDIAEVKKVILYTMINIIDACVQYNNSRDFNVPSLCNIMMEHNGTKLEALAEIKKVGRGFDEDFVNTASSFTANEHSSSWYWRYQRCSEFGMFSTFTNVTYLSAVEHILSPIEMEIGIVCSPYFGSNFSIANMSDKVRHTNSQYGGLNFTRVIFIHGSLDPCYKAGIFEKSNNSLYEAILIKGASHCADFNPPSDSNDDPELTNARNEVLEILQNWLKIESDQLEDP